MLLTSFRVLKMIVNHYLIFSNPVVRFFHLHGNSMVKYFFGKLQQLFSTDDQY